MTRPFRLASALAFIATALTSFAFAQGPAPAPKAGQAVATFAGGCFWCMEPPYDKLPGVISTTSGYMGGTKKYPTYEEVSRGITGHAKSCRCLRPVEGQLRQAVEVFWVNVDPTVTDRSSATTARSTARRSSRTRPSSGAAEA
jgi:peptide-methionine (S)-S-oxide reductase